MLINCLGASLDPRIVEILLSERKYRPEAVAVIHDSSRKFLIVCYSERKTWGYIQGGIEKGETIEETLRRELIEEAGINYDRDLRKKRKAFCAQTLEDRTKSPEKLRGYKRGKAYIHTLAEYVGDKSIIELNPRELIDYRWATYDEAVDNFKKTRGEKADMMINVLDIAMKYYLKRKRN